MIVTLAGAGHERFLPTRRTPYIAGSAAPRIVADYYSIRHVKDGRLHIFSRQRSAIYLGEMAHRF